MKPKTSVVFIVKWSDCKLPRRTASRKRQKSRYQGDHSPYSEIPSQCTALMPMLSATHSMPVQLVLT